MERVIQEIQRETGTTINIEEVDNRGGQHLLERRRSRQGPRHGSMVSWRCPSLLKLYEGTVKGIKEFGAFVEFLPKKEGLLHISEISWKRLETMEGYSKKETSQS